MPSQTVAATVAAPKPIAEAVAPAAADASARFVAAGSEREFYDRLLAIVLDTTDTALSAITATLTISAIILAAFAAVFALFGFFGYNEIKRAALKRVDETVKKHLTKQLTPGGNKSIPAPESKKKESDEE